MTYADKLNKALEINRKLREVEKLPDSNYKKAEKICLEFEFRDAVREMRKTK